MLTLGVLASGRGTDFQAIVDHVKLDVLRDVRIEILVSNMEDAEVLRRADNAGIESSFIEGISGKKFQSKEEREEKRIVFDKEVVKVFDSHKVDLIALAGFNQIVSSYLVGRFGNRIMNIHPAFDIERFGGPGMFGMKVHQTVIDAGESISGCTIHYVDSTIDRGPVIIRAGVPVMKNDDAGLLAERVLAIEHRAYPKAIQLHADKRIVIDGRKVFLDLFSGDAWELDWKRRQERYIIHQEEEWMSRGKNLRMILGQDVSQSHL